MKPIKLDNSWYIEVETEEFGKVLLLDETSNLTIPIKFNTKNKALDYIKLLDEESIKKDLRDAFNSLRNIFAVFGLLSFVFLVLTVITMK